MTFWDWLYVWMRWFKSWNWDWIASHATIGTAAIASMALGTAIVSIIVQKSVAKRRAAIDFFLKTELDSSLLSAYSDFYKATEKMKTASSLATFADSDDYAKLCNYLGVHELMALGVLNGVFDEKICYSFWSDALDSACKEAQPAIAYIRTDDGFESTYSDMLYLNHRWSKPAQFWQRWKRRTTVPTQPPIPGPAAPTRSHNPSPPSTQTKDEHQ